MWSDKLLSTNWWTNVFLVLAVVGLLVMVAGFVASAKTVVVLGLVLCGPLVLGGAVALLVGVPYLIWTDPKRRDDRQR